MVTRDIGAAVSVRYFDYVLKRCLLGIGSTLGYVVRVGRVGLALRAGSLICWWLFDIISLFLVLGIH